MLIEQLLSENPSLGHNSERGEKLEILLGNKTGSLVSLAEHAASEFNTPTEIKIFYSEFCDYIQNEFKLSPEEAASETDKLMGYAVYAAPDENRRVWLETLVSIYHPIFGRKTIKAEGQAIGGMEISFNSDKALQYFEEVWIPEFNGNTIIGSFDYETDNLKKNASLKFKGQVGYTEIIVSYIAEILDWAKSSFQKKTKEDFDYSVKFQTRDMQDFQRYWENKLKYNNEGNIWMKNWANKGILVKIPAVIKDAYIGYYDAPKTDGTPAPWGLHLDMEIQEIMSNGWAFLGSQIIDFMDKYNVSDPKELIGKKVNMLQIRERSYGIEAIPDKS